MRAPPLTPLLRPRSVAVIGASPRTNTLGNNVVVNLKAFGFAGGIYPVHPQAPEVAGLPAYRGFEDLPEAPDCAVLAVAADKVLDALEAGVARGLKAAVVFAGGFAETGESGSALQRSLHALCERSGLALCGPNCLGILNVHERVSLYSSGLPAGLRAGGLAVVSHSGSACIALSTLGRFGLSCLVSVGNAAVLDMADYLDYLATDPHTRVVALFMETLRDAGAFARAVRAMHAAGKQVVALKVGRSAAGAAASAAHTGALAGDHQAYAAFFRRHGVIAVDDFDELAESVEMALKITHAPRGDGVGVIAVSGGETALVADLAERAGLRLPALAPATVARLREVLPAFGNIANPLDTTDRGVYEAQVVYAGAMRALAADPGIGVIAVLQDCSPALSPRGANNYRRIAGTVAEVAREVDLPVVFFNTAAGGLHTRVVEPLVESPVAVMQGARASLLAVRRFIDHARFRPHEPAPVPESVREWRERFATGRPLTEHESRHFLADHGIAITRALPAKDAGEAAHAAAAIGFPVVMKIDSPDLPHKSEAGGVRLGLADGAAVRAAFDDITTAVHRFAPGARIAGVLVQEMVSGGVETIAGLAQRAPFGMNVLFGSGGVLVELIEDTALALAPIDVEEARALIARTRAKRLLEGFRGAPPADVAALAALIATLSSIGAAYAGQLEAVDLNPVSVLPRGQGAVVLDALVIPRPSTSP